MSELLREEKIAAYTGELLAKEGNDFQKDLLVALAGMNESEWKTLESIMYKVFAVGSTK